MEFGVQGLVAGSTLNVNFVQVRVNTTIYIHGIAQLTILRRPRCGIGIRSPFLKRSIKVWAALLTSVRLAAGTSLV